MITRIFSIPTFRSIVIFILFITTLPLGLPSFTGCSGTAGGNSRLEKLLGNIPATAVDDPYILLTYNDYAAYFEENGTILTSLEQLVEDLKNSLPDNASRFGILALASFISGGGKYIMKTPIQMKYVGYDITDIDAEIQFGMPPAEGVAAIGRFNPATTRDALQNQADWTDWAIAEYTTEDYNGVTIHTWGDGLKIHVEGILSPPLIDELGRARPLAVTDNYLFSESSLDVVKQMIDASHGKIKNMAGLKQYSSIARVLTDLKITSAILGNGTEANALFDEQDADVDVLKNSLSPLLKNFLAFATAPAKDGKGTYIAVVLYHENAGLARENVSLFKQRIDSGISPVKNISWSERFTGMDIKSDGNLVIAKLYTERTSYYEQWPYMNDGFLSHEE
jgi:hypothetical protein